MRLTIILGIHYNVAYQTLNTINMISIQERQNGIGTHEISEQDSYISD